MIMYRMWINAPSTLQDDHHLHGRHVLVAADDLRSKDKTIQVWFTEGTVISRMIHKLALSEGWPSTRVLN